MVLFPPWKQLEQKSPKPTVKPADLSPKTNPQEEKDQKIKSGEKKTDSSPHQR